MSSGERAVGFDDKLRNYRNPVEKWMTMSSIKLDYRQHMPAVRDALMLRHFSYSRGAVALRGPCGT
jgi:hypothetical protein